MRFVNQYVLTVFLEGTSNPIHMQVTQIGLFAKDTKGIDITDDEELLQWNGRMPHYKMLFDGCGVTHGCSGVICACGLDLHTDQVVERTKNLLEKIPSTVELIVNAVGLSRGGIGCMFLAKKFGKLKYSNLILNMLLFDPVPGNLLTVSKFTDIIGRTNANRCYNMTSCRVLNDVLAIYPYEPLPVCLFHAPVFGIYPDQCNLEEDVTLGAHQGALFDWRTHTDSLLSYLRIGDWLVDHGSPLPDRQPQEIENFELRALREIRAYMKRRDHTKSTRIGHSYNYCCLATRVNKATNGHYLNKHHQKLCEKYADSQPYELRVSNASSDDLDNEFMLHLEHSSCFVPYTLIILLIIMAIILYFNVLQDQIQ